MPCCRCNRSGHCVNCACVKTNKPCQGCFPTRLDQCSNSNPITTAPTTITSNPITTAPTTITQVLYNPITTALTSNPITTAPTTITSNPITTAPTTITYNPINTAPTTITPNPITTAPTTITPNPINTASTTIPTEPLFFTPQCEITSSEILTPLDTIHDDNLNQPHPLPRFMAISAPNFYWGEKDGEPLTPIIDEIYDEVVHWRRNLFKIPSGNDGTSFVCKFIPGLRRKLST